MMSFCAVGCEWGGVDGVDGVDGVVIFYELLVKVIFSRRHRQPCPGLRPDRLVPLLIVSVLLLNFVFDPHPRQGHLLLWHCPSLASSFWLLSS